MKLATIKKIKIVNFKGIKERIEEFDFMPKIISGENGFGKTSFLEAIRYALIGKTPTREDILRYGTAEGSVTITFNDADETEICRMFFAEKPSKVKVNGKNTTAKSAQELICSLMGTNEDYLNLNTSEEVFRELLKGELGKFLLSFVPERFDTDKLFELVAFSDKEKSVLSSKLPVIFGLEECEALYKEFFEERAGLKSSVQRFETLIQNISEKPERDMETVEKELAKILAAEQIERSYLTAYRQYEVSLANYNKQIAEIKRMEDEFSSMVVEDVDPLAKNEITRKKQEATTEKATAEGTIKTLKNNIIMFKKTLDNLGTNICPISAKLVCTTDKTAAKEELERLIKENETAIEHQNDIIASAELRLKSLTSEESELLAKERAIERKNNLSASIIRAKKLVASAPVPPEKVEKADASEKSALMAEKENIIKYNEYLKNKTTYEQLSESLEIIASLCKKFAPKGEVTEKIISFYCEIFNDEVKLLSEAIGYEVKFLPEKGLSLSVKPDKDKEFTSFDNLSTGEQLITIVIVQHLCNTLSGCNIMLIDNFNDLDTNNSIKFKDVLNELAVDYALLVVAGTNI